METTKFNELISKASNYDPDVRFMSANDLCEGIVKDEIKDAKSLDSVVIVLLK